MLIAGYLIQYCYNYTRSNRKTGRTGKKIYLSTTTLTAWRYGPLEHLPEVLGRIVENDVYLRLRDLDETLSFWRSGRQEIDFKYHTDGIAIPVECKTGRLRSGSTRLLKSMVEKWHSPFAVIITMDTLDYSDPLILQIPAFLL